MNSNSIYISIIIVLLLILTLFWCLIIKNTKSNTNTFDNNGLPPMTDNRSNESITDNITTEDDLTSSS
jgi:hypothetical protein